MRKQNSAAGFGFVAFDRRRLRKAIEEVRDKNVFVRLQALLLVAQDRPLKEAAAIVGKSVQSVYGWIKVYVRNHSPQDLYERPRTGRPAVGTTIGDDAILAALRFSPRQFGYQQTSWTVSPLAHYLSKQTKDALSERTLRRRMKALGLRYKRPRYVYSEKDPNRAQKKGRLSES